MKSKTLLFIIFLLICIIPNSLAQFSDLSLQTEQISSLYGKISTFVFGEQISTIELLFYVGLLILLYILFSRPLRLFSHLSKNSSNLVAFFLVIITVVVARGVIRNFVKAVLYIAESFFGIFGIIGILILILIIALILNKALRIISKYKIKNEKELEEEGKKRLREIGGA